MQAQISNFKEQLNDLLHTLESKDSQIEELQKKLYMKEDCMDRQNKDNNEKSNKETSSSS